jgi:hypothetical protein
MLRQAEAAPEPGTLKVKEILHRGDEELPAPMVAGALQSAGYVYIYDSRTGERSLTNRNMLPTQLQKKRDDGTPVFTVVKPQAQPARGTLKCLLHPDQPERAQYDALGLPVCLKSNLTSPYQVEQHMRHRHPTEWATIEEERKRKEKEEDREFQRSLLAAAGGKSHA